MIEIIPLTQNTPEWLDFRKNHIGASEAPIIMGASPWTTPYQLWQQKLGLLPPLVENDAMRRGKEKEEIARQEFIRQTGIEMTPAVIKNFQHPFLCASLDGANIEPAKWPLLQVPQSNEDCNYYKRIDPKINHALEIKIPGRSDHEAALDGVIPEKYKWQLLQQMIVCDLQSIFYFSWNETSSKIIEFSRDEAMQKDYLPRAKEFWDCVQNFKEPPLTTRDVIKRKDKQFLDAENAYLKAKLSRQMAELIEKMWRDRLIELSGDQCCQGNDVTITKYVCRGRVDYSAIKELNNINLEQYRKPNTVAWRVS